VFWINLPLGLAAMFLCNRALRTMPVVRRDAVIDWTGAALLVGGVTACLMVLSWGGVEFPWASSPVVGISVLAAVLLAGLIWHERRARDPILPPRLFGNPTFLRGVMIAFFTSLGLFGVTFLLPLYFQLVIGVDASGSGLLVLPFMISTVMGAFTAGQIARRLGRTKNIVLVSLGLSVAGLFSLALGPPVWGVLAASFFVGCGIGATMPAVLVQVQNTAAQGDVGAATGSLLFLRSMGGAFGSTLVGSLLAARFNAGLHAAGVARTVDLGALRGGAEGFAALGGLELGVARLALVSGFQLAFAVCGGLLLVAVGIAAGMADRELRSTAAPHDIGH